MVEKGIFTQPSGQSEGSGIHERTPRQIWIDSRLAHDSRAGHNQRLKTVHMAQRGEKSARTRRSEKTAVSTSTARLTDSPGRVAGKRTRQCERDGEEASAGSGRVFTKLRFDTRLEGKQGGGNINRCACVRVTCDGVGLQKLPYSQLLILDF